jgi:hypothetical protein
MAGWKTGWEGKTNVDSRNSIDGTVVPMPKSFFLDTNVFILLSGLDSGDLAILSGALAGNKIALCMSHVQIDEQNCQEFSDYRLKIEDALRKFTERGIEIIVEPTNEVVWDVSRFDLARFGSEELSKIDKALRKEIEKCERKKDKTVSNIAKDALIALSSLNHDFFVTADSCLFRSWKIVIESNEENRKAIEQQYKIPEIIHLRKPKGVLQAIMK